MRTSDRDRTRVSHPPKFALFTAFFLAIPSHSTMPFPMNREVLDALVSVDFLAVLASETSLMRRLLIVDQVLSFSLVSCSLSENKYALHYDNYNT